MGGTGILDRSKIEDSLTGFKATFSVEFAKASALTDVVAMRVDSDSPQETYTWMGLQPKMREWIGDRQFEELRAYAMTIANKDWANGIRIKADDIKYDKWGNIMPRVNGLAAMAAQHQEELVMEFLVKGFAGTKGLAYDGQYFFDTDHSDGGSASQSNKGTSALSSTTLDAAIQSMRERTDEKGEPIAITPKLLIVGPKLEATVRTLLDAQVGSSGATNTQFGLLDWKVSPRLIGTYDDYWFVIGEGPGGLKPLVLQQSQEVQFIAQDAPEDEGYFTRKEFRYGADWSGNVGYGLWPLAYGAIV